MNPLNVYTVSGYTGIHGTQIWEYFYSYKQSQSYPNSPSIDIDFIELELQNLTKLPTNALNILQLGMPSLYSSNILEEIEHLEFDLILLDNMFENLGVASDELLTQVRKRKNTFMIVGSFVHPEHHLYDKCITLSEDWLTCRELYTNPKVFVSYDIVNSNTKPNNLLYIGGELRTYRKFIIDLMHTNSIPVMQNTHNIVSTKNTILGSQDDQEFADVCNELYNVISVHEDNKFYNEIGIGLPCRPFGKGQTTISYLLMPEYNTYKCILYSEASFINNEVFPTEKTWKCVISNAHWIMFAGRNAYKLMADFGIHSILELTPGGIDFDNIINHADRFKKQIESVKYLDEHPEIFDTDEASEILELNYNEFLTGNKFMMPLMNKLNKILEKY